MFGGSHIKKRGHQTFSDESQSTTFCTVLSLFSPSFSEERGELIRDNYSGVQKLLYCDSPIIISFISSFHYLTKIFKASFRI